MALHTITLGTLKTANRFVSRTPGARWENYDIIRFTPKPNAAYSVKGVFDRETGKWGYEERTPISSDGTWTLSVWKHERK